VFTLIGRRLIFDIFDDDPLSAFADTYPLLQIHTRCCIYSTLLIVFNLQNMTKTLLLLLLSSLAVSGSLKAQSANFNFSNPAAPVSGWTNVVGDPYLSVVTATSNGITISSVATANWAQYNGNSAFNGLGESTGNSVFPGGVLLNHWYQYSAPGEYTAGKNQFLISGLNPNNVYTIDMAGSSTSSLNNNPVQYTVSGIIVYPVQQENNHNNSTNYASFNVAPDASGNVKVYVNTLPTTDIGDISGITITDNGAAPAPTATITSPTNGATLTQGNITISANAAVSGGGTISSVQFYAGATLIGTSSTSPYSVTWANAAPGTYSLTAKATDYLNRTVTSSAVSVTIQAAGGGGGSWIFSSGTLYDATDNVAIGTNSAQGYKFAVNGTAIFTKVLVKPFPNWPDYVFRKDYVLPGLDAVEAYIHAHHHLPGIPSEKEVSGGVDVGAQQTALLKKMEELTLYLIRENKSLREQNARLEAQQKEIDELRAMIQANGKH